MPQCQRRPLPMLSLTAALVCGLQAACGVSSPISAADAANPNALLHAGTSPTESSAPPEVVEEWPAPAPTIVLSPELDASAYWLDGMPSRADIVADPNSGIAQPGAPLTVAITLVKGSLPLVDGHWGRLSGATVDLWQANAVGVYSGDPNAGTDTEAWLRGNQQSDDTGTVTFTTIVPGWTSGRAPHLHVRVRMDGGYDWTTQVFLPDEVLAGLAAEAPYSSHAGQDTTNTNDAVYQAACQGLSGPCACGSLTEATMSLDADGNRVATLSLNLNPAGN